MMSTANNRASPMRVLLVSHSSVVDVYQDKLRHIAAHPDVDLTLVLPHAYHEAGRLVNAFEGYGGYAVKVLPGRSVEKGRQNLFTLRGLRRLIRRTAPDILHLEEEPESFVSLQAIRAALSLRRPPRIIGFSWRNFPFPYPHWPWYNPKRILLNLVQHANLPHYDALICGSHDGPREFAPYDISCPMPIIPQYGINPLLYAPHGDTIDLRTTYSIPANRLIVGFVGRVMPMKGVDTLLEACAAMGDAVHCVIVGQGDADWLGTVVQQTGMERQTTHVTGLTPSDVPRMMRSLDVMVLPSKTAPHWSEQFGRVLVEAMACGLPVVGSSSGEIPRVIGDPQFVFPESDATALADILRSLQHPDARLAARNRGIARVHEHYTNERIANDIVSLYRQLFTAPAY